MLPVPLLTFSLKVICKLSETPTALAPFAGEKETIPFSV
jgi:hypothetical protein